MLQDLLCVRSKSGSSSLVAFQALNVLFLFPDLFQICKVAFCVASRLHILRGNFLSLMANSDEVITQSGDDSYWNASNVKLNG